MDENSIELSGLEAKRKYSSLEVAIECLEWISADEQLNPRAQNHKGTLTINPYDFFNPSWQEFFSTLHLTKNYFKIVFDHFNLNLTVATEDMVTFNRK